MGINQGGVRMREWLPSMTCYVAASLLIIYSFAIIWLLSGDFWWIIIQSVHTLLRLALSILLIIMGVASNARNAIVTVLMSLLLMIIFYCKNV